MREGKARKTKFVLIALLLTLLAGCGKNSDSTDGAAKTMHFRPRQEI